MKKEPKGRTLSDRDRLEAMFGTYSELYDFAPVGYFNLDREGIIRAVNLSGAKSLGVERSSLDNKPLDRYLAEASRPVFHDFLARVFAGATKEQCEVSFLRFRQPPLFAQVEAVLSESGEECRAVVTDITERRQAEEALKQLNAGLESRIAERTRELAHTIDNLQEEVVARQTAEENVMRMNRLYAVISKTTHAIVHANDLETLFHDFCRIAVADGRFKLAWVGRLDEASGELKVVAAEGATGFLDGVGFTFEGMLEGCDNTKTSVLEGVYFVCNDYLESPGMRSEHERARAHDIRASASIALKQEGRMIGALTLYSDTKDFFDRQQIDLLLQMGEDVSFSLDNFVRESRRLEAEQALRDEITERLRIVEALREKEMMLIHQSRQAAMGEMIGNIAHQWRQPLNVLGIQVQSLSLLHDLGELTRESLDDSVARSMELIRHMSGTIDDFRNYFKPDKEEVEFKVSEAVAKTLSLVKDGFKNDHIDIEVLAKSDPSVKGHPNEFAQVILNILNNARDALLEKEIADRKVTITIDSEGGRAVMTISDNAGGIPDKIKEKIFDPYFSTKGPKEGTGIGLFMSKVIIEKGMRGSITAHNIDNGAEFRIEV